MAGVADALRGKRERDDLMGGYGTVRQKTGVQGLHGLGHGRVAGRLRQFGRGMVGGDTPVERPLTPSPSGKTSKEGAVIRGVANVLQAIENVKAAKAAEAVAKAQRDSEAEAKAREILKENWAILQSVADLVKDGEGDIAERLYRAVISDLKATGPSSNQEFLNMDPEEAMSLLRSNEESGMAKDIALTGKKTKATETAKREAQTEQWLSPEYQKGLREKTKIVESEKGKYGKPEKTDEEKIDYEIEKKKRMAEEGVAELPSQINERKRIERLQKSYDSGREKLDKEFDKKVEKAMIATESQLETMNKKYEDYGVIVVKDAKGEPWIVESTTDLWGLAEGLSEKDYTDNLHKLKTAQQRKRKKWKGLPDVKEPTPNVEPAKVEVDDPLKLLK